MRSLSTLSLHLASLPTVRWPSSVSLRSCPQIPPLEFDETIEYFDPAFLEPASASPIPSPASEQSSVRSRHSTIVAGRHSRARTTASIITTGSAQLSQVEIALRTRTSMLCSRGSPRVITKGTMEGLIRYLLLNSGGEQITAYQSAVNSQVADSCRHGAPRDVFHRTSGIDLVARCAQNPHPPV